MLICHRLILSRLFRSLFRQGLANLVWVDDRFFEREAILAPIAILDGSLGPANVAMSLGNRLRDHLYDRLWWLFLLSVDLSKVFDPSQVPLGSSRDFLGVPKQDRNPIDTQVCQVLALRAFVDARRLDSIGAYRASFRHVIPPP
jgi:hypothetical protein